jgi:hypothetical protein
LYATATPEWNARFEEIIPLDEIMMVEGMSPPSTPADELALWYVAEGDMLDRKVRALRSQASQIEPLVEMVGVEVFAETVRDEFFRPPRDDDWS